jgi:Reverse transcriptase (RNA-dependent DNA polymerase)
MYSPVAWLATFRSVLGLAAKHDWEIQQFNFNSAFLNGKLDDSEELYMQKPLGYEMSGEGSVKQLHKAIYRLKKAGCKWYDALFELLISLGFCISNADPGMFTKRIRTDILVLAMHVGDCILTSSSLALIEEYKQKLNEHYTLTDLGPVDYLLRIKSHATRRLTPSFYRSHSTSAPSSTSFFSPMPSQLTHQ